METATGISVAEYLSTVYRPDCDYVDGQLEERNVGEQDHANVEAALTAYLFNRRKQLGIHVMPNVRVQVKPTRFRVPDVCVVKLPRPEEQILTSPPFLCVEILSPEDRMSRMQERIDDYLSSGVPVVWVIDPRRRVASIHTAAGARPVTDGVLRTDNPDLAVPLSELFEP